MPAQDIGALGAGPGHKLVGQPRFADAGLAYQQHRLRLALPRLLVETGELGEGRGPSDERGDQHGWRPALRRGGGGMGGETG